MKEFSVYFNAYAGASYKIKAESAKEAVKIARKYHQDLGDCEAGEWDFENPGEVTDLETYDSVDINDLEGEA